MAAKPRLARVEDVHELALSMPHVTVVHGRPGNPIYQVGGKSFVFFRTPRPDATDPQTGERYPDVIVFWVPSESDKQALVQDQMSPFFSTSHFDGHPSVLVLICYLPSQSSVPRRGPPMTVPSSRPAPRRDRRREAAIGPGARALRVRCLPGARRRGCPRAPG